MEPFPTWFRLPPAHGRAALTIDDGPNPDTTLALLDVFDAFGSCGNFFALGTNLRQFPELAEQIVKRGHGLFSHGFDHTAFPQLSPAAIGQQLQETEQLLQQFRPSPPVPLIRFPYGAGTDDPGVRQAVAAWHKDAVAVQWSLCAEEWTFMDQCRTPSQIQEQIKRRVAALDAPGDGAIILMHDWPAQPAKPLTAAFCAGLLETYLEMLAFRRLQTVRLDRL